MVNMVELAVGVIFVLLMLIPITLTLVLLIYAARTATSWVGQCRGCGYNLRGLSDGRVRSCPECGQSFVVNSQGNVIS